MLIRRTVTASDVPTLRTPTEMKPPTSRRRQAFYTSVATWFRNGVDSARRLFHLRFSLVAFVRNRMSSQQQDLPDITLFRGSLSSGRLAEWQLVANRDHQFAISDGLGHKLQSFPVGRRLHRRHLYRGVLRGIPWPAEDSQSRDRRVLRPHDPSRCSPLPQCCHRETS